MDEKADNRHLTDPELFTLALPPAGEPEALPRHLSECFACSRALQEWKLAVRETAQEEIEPIERRSAADWESLENETIEAMRRARRAGPSPAVKWAVSAAAALLLAVLVLPARKSGRAEEPGGAPAVVAHLSAQDQNDDALLRDVARLSRGEDPTLWNGLAPEPGSTEEEKS